MSSSLGYCKYSALCMCIQSDTTAASPSSVASIPQTSSSTQSAALSVDHERETNDRRERQAIVNDLRNRCENLTVRKPRPCYTCRKSDCKEQDPGLCLFKQDLGPVRTVLRDRLSNFPKDKTICYACLLPWQTAAFHGPADGEPSNGGKGLQPCKYRDLVYGFIIPFWREAGRADELRNRFGGEGLEGVTTDEDFGDWLRQVNIPGTDLYNVWVVLLYILEVREAERYREFE